MRGIAYRRHTQARAKARARRKIKVLWNWTPSNGVPACEDPSRIGMMAATRTPCSCPVCGNPRRHFGTRMMAERRADDEFRAEINDLLPVSTVQPMLEMTL